MNAQHSRWKGVGALKLMGGGLRFGHCLHTGQNSGERSLLQQPVGSHAAVYAAKAFVLIASFGFFAC